MSQVTSSLVILTLCFSCPAFKFLFFSSIILYSSFNNVDSHCPFGLFVYIIFSSFYAFVSYKFCFFSQIEYYP
jgi:hypothetical protein